LFAAVSTYPTRPHPTQSTRQQALESPTDPRAEAYHTLLKELLIEAERTAHKRDQRLIFMACLARLLPRVRLYAARHLSRVAPLLLEWLLAVDGQTRCAAAGCWEAVLRCCWPRAGAHAAVVWRHLAAAARAVDSSDWEIGGRGGGGSGGTNGGEEDRGEVLRSFEELGRLLVAIVGREAVLEGAFSAHGVGGGGSRTEGVEATGRCEAALLALVS